MSESTRVDPGGSEVRRRCEVRPRAREADRGRRAVLVILDGARADVFEHLLRRGDLPNIARRVIEPGGYGLGTTVFPSTTGPAYVPLLLGRYPGSAGIPGIRWLDRNAAAGGWIDRWRAARSYCGVQSGWIDRDITVGPSIFDLVPDSLAICSPVTRGLTPGRHLIPLKRALLGVPAHYFGTYAALDRAVADAWVHAAERDWRFLFVVFPGPDGLMHLTHPRHSAVLERYRASDRALGAFLARLRRVGRGEEPELFIASDHGASEVDEHCDVALALESWKLPTIRHPLHVWRPGARAAVMVSGNGCAHVYLDPRSGRDRPLVDSEIPRDLLERLAGLPAVQLAAWRDNQGGVLVSVGGRKARLLARGHRVRYEPLTGDALGLGSTPATFADRTLLGLSRHAGLPDAPRQLLQLFGSPRTGDIALAARAGSDFRGPWELPEHRAGHGSLIGEHMFVPVASTVGVPARARTVDLMPTILETLGIAVPPGLDGVPFSRHVTPAARQECAASGTH